MAKGVNPRSVLSDLGVENDQIPKFVDDFTIWKIIINMLAEPPRRNKLRHVNTLDDVVRLLRGNILKLLLCSFVNVLQFYFFSQNYLNDLI